MDMTHGTNPIYLDHNATTPVAPEVVAAMLPFLQEHFGNPSSDHAYADAPRRAMAAAREEVARLIGARPAEIVFTGSATEANNLAILGVAQTLGSARRHAVISAIEQDELRERLGIQFVVVGIKLDYHRAARFNDQLAVSVMLASMQRASLVFAQDVRAVSAGTALVCSAEVRVACVDSLNFKPKPLPREIVAELA